MRQQAERAARAALARRPTLGTAPHACRLVCVDGPAGSGKTTLAAALADQVCSHGSCEVVHMDDLYEGWDGLGADLHLRIERDLLTPLARGTAGHWRRYDWETERFAESHRVVPVDWLLLEGVGSAALRYDALVTLRVWVEADERLRLARGIQRDGTALRPQWLAWMESEARLFAAEETRGRADLILDGTGSAAPPSPSPQGPTLVDPLGG